MGLGVGAGVPLGAGVGAGTGIAVGAYRCHQCVGPGVGFDEIDGEGVGSGNGSADGAGVGTDVGAWAAANQSPESATKRLIEAAILPHTARA